MIYTYVRTRAVREKDSEVYWHTKSLGKGRCLNLQHVVRHLPGGDPLLRWVNARDRVLSKKPEAKRRSEKIAITVTQCLRPRSVRRSHNLALIVDCGCFGN